MLDTRSSILDSGYSRSFLRKRESNVDTILFIIRLTNLINRIRMNGIIMNKNELLNSGLKKFATQDYTGAISDLEKAVELDPKYDLALNALAESFNKLGELDKAIEIAKKYVVSPVSVLIWVFNSPAEMIENSDVLFSTSS